MRVSRVGEQKAHCRPQPRFISTIPYVERPLGVTSWSKPGSGARTTFEGYPSIPYGGELGREDMARNHPVWGPLNRIWTVVAEKPA